MEDDQIESLLTRRRFTTDHELVDWLTQDIVGPLVRIAISDASQAERRRAVEAISAEWDPELPGPDDL